jgi:hypothetical protein
MTSERRQAPRVPAVFAVKRCADGGWVQLCQAEDIGPTGMTIRRPRGISVPPQTPMSLAFTLPGFPDEIAAEAMVVSDVVAGSFRRTGLRFTVLEPGHAQLITELCLTPEAQTDIASEWEDVTTGAR